MMAADPPLIVEITGFEGPLDVLLSLARQEKLDLRQIAIVPLVDQYLAFIAQAQRARLELAADYLVMTAWLVLLKSRLLLPPNPKEADLRADEMVWQLSRRIERLDHIRRAADHLMARDQLYDHVFPRGMPQDLRVANDDAYDVALPDLLRAYAGLHRRDVPSPVVARKVYTFPMRKALERLSDMITGVGEWADLTYFLPQYQTRSLVEQRSMRAAHFVAALDLAKVGLVEMRQAHDFAPVQIRHKAPD